VLRGPMAEVRPGFIVHRHHIGRGAVISTTAICTAFITASDFAAPCSSNEKPSCNPLNTRDDASESTLCVANVTKVPPRTYLARKLPLQDVGHGWGKLLDESWSVTSGLKQGAGPCRYAMSRKVVMVAVATTKSAYAPRKV
jgi:hypothetical protein